MVGEAKTENDVDGADEDEEDDAVDDIAEKALPTLKNVGWIAMGWMSRNGLSSSPTPTPVPVCVCA